MLGHISFSCSDLQVTSAFYQAVLGALGYVELWRTDTAVGYGVKGAENEPFAIKLRDKVIAPGAGFHLAFSAPTRKSVDEFHQAALKFGGSDKGAAGLRPQYGPHYYAAFVLDPDGYYIEAVCQREA